MQLPTLLIIGLVWPEPLSSAAGKRMLQLIEIFSENNFNIVFASAATTSEYSANLDSKGVTCKHIELNSESFDVLVQEIDPSVVLFDRFVMEEQYGWRVAEVCPNAVRILDTEDLHFLRSARTKALKSNSILCNKQLLSEPMAKREIASLLRCDLSLIISEYEMELLTNVFRIDPRLLYYVPLFTEQNHVCAPFESRADFMFIGNYLHEPNLDAVRYLKLLIWPRIREILPTAVVRICGAYPSQEVLQMHDVKDGFLILGRVKDALTEIGRAKILLAPLRMGAGIKGKLLEAIAVGTPSVTTTIGAEGIASQAEWPGELCDDDSAFASSAVRLFLNKEDWQNSLRNRQQLLDRFNKETYAEPLMKFIEQIRTDLKLHRAENFYGNMLQHHSLASTKYMSLWISEKNKNKISR